MIKIIKAFFGAIKTAWTEYCKFEASLQDRYNNGYYVNEPKKDNKK